MLTRTIVFERVQPIPRWHALVGALSRHVDRFQFSQGATPREAAAERTPLTERAARLDGA